MALDLAPDFDLFDNVETVSYQRRNLAGASVGSPFSVTALKRATTGGLVDFSAGAQSFLSVANWHFKGPTLPGGTKKGDQFTSTQWGLWEIMEDSTETLGARYKASCKQVSP